MDKDKQKREDIYQRTRDDLLKRQLSNSENFDKAILTLSSAGLGLSLTFIKHVVQFDAAQNHWLLVLSWVMFVLSILVTLVSFHISQAGIAKQLEIAEDYYLKDVKDALERPNNAAVYTERAGYFSATTFLIAIIALVLFISLNINRKENKMSDEQKHQSGDTQKLEGGAPVPQLQKVIIDKGATIPALQQSLDTGDRGAPIPSIQRIPDAAASGTSTGGDTSGQQDTGDRGAPIPSIQRIPDAASSGTSAGGDASGQQDTGQPGTGGATPDE